MEEFLELLKYTVPSIVVAVVVYLMVSKMLEQENRRHFAEVKKENLKYTTPVRLQAHERVLLLLERTDPVQVVNRVIKPGMTAKSIQFAIITEIKQEYDHNVTQQLYVSGKCWIEVMKAKEDALKLVTVAAASVGRAADAMEFSKALIKIQSDQQFFTSAVAIKEVKREITKIF
ncbi:MAG: hypothetical protein ACJA0Q_000440 [Saprospiraceae bacterium]|jgi:hypothetical protein